MALKKTTVILVVFAIIFLIFSVGFSLFVESKKIDNSQDNNYIVGNPEGHVNIIVTPYEGGNITE